MNVFLSTRTASNPGDSVFLELTLDPGTEVIRRENMLPGEEVSGVVNVQNTGTVDTIYFISLAWFTAGTSISSQAVRLAEQMEVRIEVPDPATLFQGKVSELIGRPRGGRFLSRDWFFEDVSFTFRLPEDTTSPRLPVRVNDGQVTSIDVNLST